ncbi:MAG TPA: hypothetical protein VEN81_07515, partial [Planctomycetota bacterium]|nr:hypothetical protein [Planctomycetota bacterium]
TGKVAVLALPLLALLGRGPAAERGLATLEDALVLGGLGALAAIVHHARLAQPRGDPNAQDGPIAPFRIELQGTPEEAARARTVLGGLRPQAAPA